MKRNLIVVVAICLIVTSVKPLLRASNIRGLINEDRFEFEEIVAVVELTHYWHTRAGIDTVGMNIMLLWWQYSNYSYSDDEILLLEYQYNFVANQKIDSLFGGLRRMMEPFVSDEEIDSFESETKALGDYEEIILRIGEERKIYDIKMKEKLKNVKERIKENIIIEQNLSRIGLFMNIAGFGLLEIRSDVMRWFGLEEKRKR